MTLRKRILEQLELLPATNVELAHKLKANPASISSLTNKMVKAGVLNRRLTRSLWEPKENLPWIYSVRGFRPGFVVEEKVI